MPTGSVIHGNADALGKQLRFESGVRIVGWLAGSGGMEATPPIYIPLTTGADLQAFVPEYPNASWLGILGRLRQE